MAAERRLSSSVRSPRAAGSLWVRGEEVAVVWKEEGESVKSNGGMKEVILV